MAKKPDITTIATGYYSRQALNSNFENLQTGFDNTLSLDGSTPNAMGADLDMNGNVITNASAIYVGGDDVVTTTATALAAAVEAQADAEAAVVSATASAATATTGASTATTKASEASASASAASTSETNAATSESNAATSETNAATSASSASTSATTATAAASTATTKASEASTSATNASNSATLSVNSASAAQTAQTAAEAALDSFDDIYLGPKASEPTLDNDGDALVAGSLYYNTTLDKLYVYSGSVWQVTAGAAAGDLQSVNNLSDLTNFATARDNLGLVIGTDVQAYSTVLANTTASFTTADETKLDGIEALADVTDTTNVTAAGALMDSELTSISSIKALNQGVATTDSPTFAGLTSGDATFNTSGNAGFSISSVNPALKLTDTDTSESSRLWHAGTSLYVDNTGTGNTIFRNGATNTQRVNIKTTGDVAFRDDTGATESFYWDASAESLGLGTTTPSSTLDVVGNAEINGNITVTGTVDGRDVAVDGVTLDGLEAQYDSTRVVYRVAPAVPERAGSPDPTRASGPTWFPSTGAPYLNTIISADGPSDSDIVWRSVLIGDSVGSTVAEMSQAVAVGNGAMRFSGTSDATTAVGSLSLQWLGLKLEAGEDNSDALLRTVHDFVWEVGGDPLTNIGKRLDDVTWDKFGLETSLPGTRAKLNAVVIPTDKAELQGNTAVGRNSGLHLVKGYDNTLVGRNALAHGFDSTENVAIGNRALRDGALANQNVAVGTAAGQSFIEGSDNIFIGDHAGFYTTDGSNNLFIGSWAGHDFTGAASNKLSIGMGDGVDPLISGDFSTKRLGINTTTPASELDVNGTVTISGSTPKLRVTDTDAADKYSDFYNATGATYIESRNDTFNGSIIFRGRGGGATTEYARFNSNGRLGIGTSNPVGTLHVDGNTYFGNPPDGLPSNNASGSGAVMNSTGKLSMLGDSDWSLGIGRHTTEGKVAYFYYGGSVVGNISVTASATAYNTSSDYRLKEDWQPMVGASDRVMALNPVNFAWKLDGSRVDGFLAHEVQSVAPEVVTGEKDAVDADGVPEMQAIDQSKLVPLLTAALQEALTKIDALEVRVAAMEAL